MVALAGLLLFSGLIIDRKGISNEARFKFIVCRYCCMLRNKSMYAEKAYPMFRIKQEHKDTPVSDVESILIDVMLLTAIGFMREIEKKDNWLIRYYDQTG
ncbi:MAG: hypothetical protein ACSW8A_05280 [Lachnospiraceae bacterium]